jgi:hypothetical protein
MTACSIYIGDLEDPSFKWDGGDWNGNIPRSLYKQFPHKHNPYNSIFHEWARIAGIACKQTDFDGYVARVNKKQILAYIDYCYGDEASEELEKLRGFVETLDELKIYGLVAECY